MTKSIEFDLTKDLSLWSEEEKAAFIDMTDSYLDFGDSLSPTEFNIRQSILNA